MQKFNRLALIGIILVCIVGSFAYVAGWLSPGLLTPSRFVDAFEQVNGVHVDLPRFSRRCWAAVTSVLPLVVDR
jgi:hypothetical protein